jgi:UDP-glucose 4-epimerase
VEEMKVALITSANGFVGQNLVNYFYKNNWKIIAIDIEENLSQSLYNKTDYIIVDLLDKRALNNVFHNYSKIDVVIHAAGISDHFPNIPWRRYFDINVKGSKNIAKLSAEYNVDFFVYLSSASVYGREYGNVTEKDNLCEYDYYSQSKILGEKEVLHNNINSIILRPSPFYGFGDPKNTVYKLFYYINKTHISPKTNQVTKSLCYIENLCNFIELLINKNKGFGEIYNIARC